MRGPWHADLRADAQPTTGGARATRLETQGDQYANPLQRKPDPALAPPPPVIGKDRTLRGKARRNHRKAMRR